jgi:hypothetical protein
MSAAPKQPAPATRELLHFKDNSQPTVVCPYGRLAPLFRHATHCILLS